MNDDLNKYFDANKILWDMRTLINKDSGFYDLTGFKKGKSSLNFIELNDVGDVKGKSLLHLQCHFGLDTMSWARLGAKTTGVDFSGNAIDLARQLNDELGLDTEFICSNIYDLKEHLYKKFDIIFTSYGVIGWLPDLNKWAELINYYLMPGGVFYMVEFHPVVWMFDNDFKYLKYSYFYDKEPIAECLHGTYSNRDADIKLMEYGWNHSLSEVISVLQKNNLQIELFNEFPFSVYNCFPNTVQGKDGYWRIKGFEDIIPMMYSLKARKKN